MPVDLEPIVQGVSYTAVRTEQCAVYGVRLDIEVISCLVYEEMFPQFSMNCLRLYDITNIPGAELYCTNIRCESTREERVEVFSRSK